MRSIRSRSKRSHSKTKQHLTTSRLRNEKLSCLIRKWKIAFKKGIRGSQDRKVKSWAIGIVAWG